MERTNQRAAFRGIEKNRTGQERMGRDRTGKDMRGQERATNNEA